MKKYKSYIFILFLLVTFIGTSNLVTNDTKLFNTANHVEIKKSNQDRFTTTPNNLDLKTYKIWKNFTYIHIQNDNWSKAIEWGWCSGEGTVSDPYVLKTSSLMVVLQLVMAS